MPPRRAVMRAPVARKLKMLAKDMKQMEMQGKGLEKELIKAAKSAADFTKKHHLISGAANLIADAIPDKKIGVAVKSVGKIAKKAGFGGNTLSGYGLALPGAGLKLAGQGVRKRKKLVRKR